MRYTLSELYLRLQHSQKSLQQLNDDYDGKVRTSAFYRDYAYLVNKIKTEQHRINQYGCNVEVYQINFIVNNQMFQVTLADISETEIIPLITIRYKESTSIQYQRLPTGKVLKL